MRAGPRPVCRKGPAHLIRALLALLLVLAAGPASAVWNHPREIIHSTANTLEKGELIVGVITPLVYGISDDLTLMSHPVLVALLTPNAGLRYRLVDSEVVTFSVTVEGAATITTDDGPLPNDDRPMGHIYAGVAITFDIGQGVLLSVSTGYQHEFQQRTNGVRQDDDAVAFGVGMDWLASPHSLFLLSLGSQYSTLNTKLEATTGSLMYAYAFDDSTRLGVGLAFGKFPVALDDDTSEVLPVWPVIDWWARF
jgi:hypothetical protein